MQIYNVTVDGDGDMSGTLGIGGDIEISGNIYLSGSLYGVDISGSPLNAGAYDGSGNTGIITSPLIKQHVI